MVVGVQWMMGVGAGAVGVLGIVFVGVKERDGGEGVSLFGFGREVDVVVVLVVGLLTRRAWWKLV